MHTVCLVSVVARELLLQFHPPGGPVEGGTKLNVSGTNLGKAAADLQVTIAGIVCSVEVESYIPSERCVVFASWSFVFLLLRH